MKNYYEILEISKNASSEIIDKAYKTLAKKYHPDTYQDISEKTFAENKFKEINEAYKILSNIDSRKSYDFKLSQEDLLIKNAENKDLQNKLNNLQEELNFYRTKKVNSSKNITSNPTNSSWISTLIRLCNEYLKKPKSEKIKDFISLFIAIIFMVCMLKLFNLI